MLPVVNELLESLFSTLFSRQESTQSLWFGRDIFGRRSLLWHTPSKDDNLFALCSVGQYSEQEMPLVSMKIASAVATL